MRNLYPNGFLVRIPSLPANNPNKKIYNNSYSGVDATFWSYYENYSINIDIFSKYRDERYVDVCVSFEKAMEYALLLKSDNIGSEILFSCTSRPLPVSDFNIKRHKNEFTFIGYDYAYSEGSYYSCLNNDIGRIGELNHLRTNSFELFYSKKKLMKFIKEREILSEDSAHPYRFELGDFIIYKLWKYNKEI